MYINVPLPSMATKLTPEAIEISGYFWCLEIPEMGIGWPIGWLLNPACGTNDKGIFKNAEKSVVEAEWFAALFHFLYLFGLHLSSLKQILATWGVYELLAMALRMPRPGQKILSKAGTWDISDISRLAVQGWVIILDASNAGEMGMAQNCWYSK